MTIEELTKRLEEIKQKQIAILEEVSIDAGIPIPTTLEEDYAELGKRVMAAWQEINFKNSRQLNIFNLLNKPETKVLIQAILTKIVGGGCRSPLP